MWPTFFVPAISQEECWDYYIPSGTVTRDGAVGVVSDSEVSIPLAAHRNYRITGRLLFVLGSASPRGQVCVMNWLPSVTLAGAIDRSFAVVGASSTAEPVIPRNTVLLGALGTDISTNRTVGDYPTGETTTHYLNMFVDLYVRAGASNAALDLRWGNSNPAGGAITLSNSSLLVVKEYPQ